MIFLVAFQCPTPRIHAWSLHCRRVSSRMANCYTPIFDTCSSTLFLSGSVRSVARKRREFCAQIGESRLTHLKHWRQKLWLKHGLPCGAREFANKLGASATLPETIFFSTCDGASSQKEFTMLELCLAPLVSPLLPVHRPVSHLAGATCEIWSAVALLTCAELAVSIQSVIGELL